MGSYITVYPPHRVIAWLELHCLTQEVCFQTVSKFPETRMIYGPKITIISHLLTQLNKFYLAWRNHFDLFVTLL